LAYVELEEVLHDAIDSSRPLIDECGHTLVLSPLHNKVLVEGDAIRLTQVFTNLLNNAAKYMDRGGNIEVTVSQGRDEVLVAVRDAGIGIALERLEDVFELFSQVETALSRSRGGLGIGLSLSRRLVEMHRGSIEVHSMGLGHGSEFVVRLPLISTPHNEMVIEPEPSQSACEIAVEAPETHRELRILVADDNKDSASTLTMVLEMMGHSVRQVHDGEAAVTQATAFDPHLIFLDIGMPKLHGYEACRQIRAKPGGAARTVVAITGWGQPSDRAMSQQSGFDQHLVKPVELSQLDTVIAKLTQQAPWP
jgi:CheY-like chemotaxis protein